MIDTDDYEGHTPTYWSARNVGDGSLESCDNDYDHDNPFIETDDGKGENPAIGYLIGGFESHSLEEKRANMKLIADAPDLLAEVKRLREILGDIVEIEEWGGDGKDIGITIRYGDGYVFRGWLDKVHEGDDE